MDESKINAAAEADIAWLQSVMLALRQIRAEMNIAPSKAIPLIVEGQDERLGRFASSIVFLAKIETLDVAASRIPESAVAVVGGLKLHVPLAGLIDVGAEIARLERSLAKLEQGLTGNVAKLDNPQFQKAPEAVQQKTRELIGQQQSEIATLQGQLLKMRGL
jgi:valyl-tRNA synthetase